MHEVSVDLTDVEPTSIAGVIALLPYFAWNDVKDGSDGTAFPELLFDDDDPAINKNCGAPYSYFIAQNVTRTLSRLKQFENRISAAEWRGSGFGRPFQAAAVSSLSQIQ